MCMSRGRGLLLMLTIAGTLLLPVRASQADEGPSALAVERAQAPVDHRAIAEAYDEQAAALRQKVTKHQAMLDSYQKLRGYTNVKGDPVAHCKSLIAYFEGAAEATAALARYHRELAAGIELR